MAIISNRSGTSFFGGGGTSAAIIARITNLETNEKQVIYWASVSSASGTITIPTGATIILDQFQGGADAFASTIVNGQPSGIFPQTSGGVNVDVASFDALGNFTLTGTPSAYPIALVYVLQIEEVNWKNLTLTYVVEQYNVTQPPDLTPYALINPRVNTIASSTTPTFNIDSYDELHITALSGNITTVTITGTTADSRVIIFEITDNGLARTITWGPSFAAGAASLPTTTVTGKILFAAFKYNSGLGVFQCMAASISL